MLQASCKEAPKKGISLAKGFTKLRPMYTGRLSWIVSHVLYPGGTKCSSRHHNRQWSVFTFVGFLPWKWKKMTARIMNWLPAHELLIRTASLANGCRRYRHDSDTVINGTGGYPTHPVLIFITQSVTPKKHTAKILCKTVILWLS